MEFIQITGVSLMLRNKKNGYWFCAKCVQASDVARLEHLSDAVVCLESFAGTPMETDSTFKAYNGSNFLFLMHLHSWLVIIQCFDTAG